MAYEKPNLLGRISIDLKSSHEKLARAAKRTGISKKRLAEIFVKDGIKRLAAKKTIIDRDVVREVEE